MRRLLAVPLSCAILVATLPVTATERMPPARNAARVASLTQDQTGTLQGIAQGADKAPLSNYSVQVVNLQNGQIVATTTSNVAGEFSFAGLTPGNYAVQIVDAAGKIVGTSSSVAVAAGTVATVTVSVSAAAVGAIAAGGGLSLLGLGTAASVAVISTATVVGIVVATQAVGGPTSPSQ